ncbi:MAG: hypothetical protein HFG68_11875 [Hungatella sp.]|nr:hypothetical protein [Hungatella sp.]
MKNISDVLAAACGSAQFSFLNACHPLEVYLVGINLRHEYRLLTIYRGRSQPYLIYHEEIRHVQ